MEFPGRIFRIVILCHLLKFLLFCSIPVSQSQSASDCSTLLCYDRSIGCRAPGTYPAADCTCTSCPLSTDDLNGWKYRCLTSVLKVCSNAIPTNPPSSECDLCSDQQMKCSNPASHYPDSACVCVPCSTAAESAELMQCAKQRGFCTSETVETSTMEPFTRTPQDPSGNCTRQQLMQCKSCSESLDFLHSNGSCRACPYRRDADRDCKTRDTMIIGSTVPAALLVIIGTIATLIYLKRTDRLPLCRKSKQTEQGLCVVCKEYYPGQCKCFKHGDGDTADAAEANVNLLEPTV